jgi:hypothetical protein
MMLDVLRGKRRTDTRDNEPVADSTVGSATMAQERAAIAHEGAALTAQRDRLGERSAALRGELAADEQARSTLLVAGEDAAADERSASIIRLREQLDALADATRMLDERIAAVAAREHAAALAETRAAAVSEHRTRVAEAAARRLALVHKMRELAREVAADVEALGVAIAAAHRATVALQAHDPDTPNLDRNFFADRLDLRAAEGLSEYARLHLRPRA